MKIDIHRQSARPRRGLGRAVELGGALAAFAMLVAAAPALRAKEAAASGRLYAVATENETVSRAALRVLERGGNAVDAAVTGALSAGVASPTSSGMGGGAFALVWMQATRQIKAFDFRETAPRALDVAALERRPLEPPERGKLVGVPGEVRGLYEMHGTLGRLPWADVVRPAIGVATDGFRASPHLGSMMGFVGPRLSVDGELTALFLPHGHAVIAGERIKNPKLAATLQRVAAEGPAALYMGSIASELAANAAAAGGALTYRDIAEYRVRMREPLHVSWEGYDIYTMGPPSGGGLMLAETLGVLDAAELKALGFNSAAYAHRIAEALRGALSDRMRFVSDPDQQPVDVPKLLDPARLAGRKRSFSPDKTQSLPAFAAQEHGTHHMVFSDQEGNVVSLTTTVNHPFGAMITGTTSGVVLNDELDDFTQASAVKALGMRESPNRPRPLARPVSSMTPTIVMKDGKPVLALGGSGGMTIGPSVIQVLLARLVFGETPERALAAPRVLVPTEGSTIAVDPSVGEELRADLTRRGETVSQQKWLGYAVQMVAFEGGKKLPAADGRKHGSALAE